MLRRRSTFLQFCRLVILPTWVYYIANVLICQHKCIVFVFLFADFSPQKRERQKLLFYLGHRGRSALPNSTFRRKVDSHPYALFKNRLLKPIFRKLKFAKQISLLPKKGSPFSAARLAKKRPEKHFCFGFVPVFAEVGKRAKNSVQRKIQPAGGVKTEKKKKI